MYKIIDHTGDVGIEIENETLHGLIEDAIKGLYSIFLEAVKPEIKGEKEIYIEGKDIEELLVETLKEMIFLFDTKKIIFVKFVEGKVDENRIYGRYYYDIFNSERYKVLSGGVKAATYHNLKVIKRDGKYYAQIIIDV